MDMYLVKHETPSLITYVFLFSNGGVEDKAERVTLEGLPDDTPERHYLSNASNESVLGVKGQNYRIFQSLNELLATDFDRVYGGYEVCEIWEHYKPTSQPTV